MVFHGLDFNRTQPGCVGNGRAAHARENDRTDHINMTQAAFHPADEGQGVVVNAVGNAGVVHQVASQDEKRYGQQREAVNARDHAVNHHKSWQAAGPPDVDERRARHGNRHRNTAGHEDQKNDF